MLSILLAVPSCIYSFWHGVILTSYFDIYTTLQVLSPVDLLLLYTYGLHLYGLSSGFHVHYLTQANIFHGTNPVIGMRSEDVGPTISAKTPCHCWMRHFKFMYIMLLLHKELLTTDSVSVKVTSVVPICKSRPNYDPSYYITEA